MAQFRFYPVDEKYLLKNFNSAPMKENLMKWGLLGRLQIRVYSFDQNYTTYKAKQLIPDFFNDKNVTTTLLTAAQSANGQPSAIGPVGQVKFERIGATVKSMEFFDRLFSANAVCREDGDIVGCFEEYSEDNLIITDELRKMLLMPESENYQIFSKSDRDELLFRLFLHLSVGGELCQHEINIKPYLEAAKLLYKDLVAVVKTSGDQPEVRVVSEAFTVSCSQPDQPDKLAYPAEWLHVQNFAYLVVNPVAKTVACLSHVFGCSL